MVGLKVDYSRETTSTNALAGLTEEQIIHTFSQAGTVLNFRLVYDKETGRPKGFGFAEFADADAAASAVRNLNNHDIMGRTLRVDYSNEGNAGSGGVDGAKDSGENIGAQQAQPIAQPSQPMLPPLPPGQDLPPGLTCPDAISRTLSQLPPDQILSVLAQLKGLVTSDPAKAIELLRQAPQLSYAIFQALLLLGLVDTSVLAQVVDQAASAPAPPPQPMAMPPPQHLPPPPHQMPAQSPFPGYPHPPQPGQPGALPLPQYPPHMAHLHPGMQQHAPTPPPQYQQPPPPIPPPQMQMPPPPQQQPPQVADQQMAMIRQILTMTQQQIDALPPPERAQLLQVRQQFLMAGYRA